MPKGLAESGGVYVIAEAGVNHNGDLARALEMIDAAKQAGADAIKFQTARAENVVTDAAPKAAYQLRTTPSDQSQIEMLRQILLPFDDHFALVDRCRTVGIDFLSTPFDADSLGFLVEELGLRTIKIPSGEVTNGPLVLEVARRGCDVIMSTGMCTTEDVRTALGVLAFGFAGKEEPPSLAAFETAFETSRDALTGRVTLLHCTTEYPAPMDEANLAAMDTLRSEFGLPVGFSDHTEGIVAAIAAAARGAVVIEKHFTLDRALPGPDHVASIEPDDLTAMVASIREACRALGDGKKRPTGSEQANMDIARKSLVALKPLRKGDTFSPENLGAKRPGSGISPMEYWIYLGRKADRDFEAGELIG